MIRLIYVVIAFLISTAAMLAQESEEGTITVAIKNIESDKGTVLVGLYNKKDKFLKNAYLSVSKKIEDGTSSAIFTNVPNGTYAISVYHDENGNKKLDKNFMGIPKEDTGTSNDAPAIFGPPTWEDAKFKFITNSKNIIIKL